MQKKFNLDDENLDTKFVKNLIFYTNSEVENGKFRARIYDIKDNGLPGEDLIYDEIIVKVKKGKRKNIVNVSKYNLQIPEEGIIVGFESLIIEENKYLQEAREFKTKKVIEIDNFSPHILYHYSDKEISYASKINKWTKQLFSMYSNRDKKEVLAPAINITLTN